MSDPGHNEPCLCGSGKKFKRCCLDRPTTAALRLIEETCSEGRSIELVNFAKFNDALGPEVLATFSQCLVHTDRLLSMISFAAISAKHHGEHSTAFGRDLHTMVWFTIGTMRELAIAIRALHNALAKKGILKSDSEHWQKLKVITTRWDGDATFIRIRNEAAFHVDPAVIERGIEVLVREARDVELLKADNGKLINSSFTLGTTVLHNGIGWDMERYGQFLEHVSTDHGVVMEAVQWAFIEATEAVGISVVQTWPA